MLLEVLHVAWHVVGSLAVGHYLARWWGERRERRRLVEDAALRLGAQRRNHGERRRWGLRRRVKGWLARQRVPAAVPMLILAAVLVWLALVLSED